MTMAVGFIGLGSMGAPMAANLAKAHLLKAVWNRTPAKAVTLARTLNVDTTPDLVELAKRCQVVCLCVTADQDVLEVIDALLPGLDAGTVVIDHSTVSVETALLAAEKLRTRNAAFLDAPVSGGVEGALAGTLAIMVGGDQHVLERVRPVLEAVGKRITHMGNTGTGQATKAVNQILCAGINQAVTEALGFGQALGLDLDKVIEVVSQGAAGNWFLAKRGPTMIQSTFEPGFKLALHHKDLEICKQMADRAGFPLPLTETSLADYQKLIAQGHGREDISALYRLKQPAPKDRGHSQR